MNNTIATYLPLVGTISHCWDCVTEDSAWRIPPGTDTLLLECEFLGIASIPSVSVSK